MKYDVQPDFPVTDDAAKAATGKTLQQWFAALDKIDALKQGRRAVNLHLVELKVDPWWCTTISVEYERHNNVLKKDGLPEGYFICSTKTIGAPVPDVFAAWAGGTFGRMSEDVKVQRVRDNKDIRLTFENPGFSSVSQVEVVFQDKGKGKTGLLVNHSRIQSRPEADTLRRAWADALTSLKAACEA